MSNKIDPKEEEERKRQYLQDMLTSNDAEVLRQMLLTSFTAINYLQRRVQIHTILHPLVFFAGFLTCYFLFM
tara:strand:- start:95 stop:310 length:216 start_codon:yes stop_codon:yes gene_type:complete